MESKFDPAHTIEENFPQIVRPVDEEFDMLDCKIDVTDSDMPIELTECKSELLKFYYIDLHQICNRILKHTLHMLDSGLLVDDSGNSLTRKSQSVIDFLALEEVKYTELD